MRSRSWMLAAAAAVLGLSGAASAQCPKVSFSKYGTTCPFFNQSAALDGSFDSTTCVTTLVLGRSTTCCNTYLALQALMLSGSKIDPGLKHPLLVTGCLLSVVPDVVLVLPSTSGGTLRLPLPAVPFKLTFYLQGLNDYFTTIGFSHDFQTSQGLQLDIS